MTTRRTTTRRVLAGSPFNKPDAPAAPVETYEVDDRVCHDRHGLGRVVAVEAGNIVLVDFNSTMQRVAADSPKFSKL